MMEDIDNKLMNENLSSKGTKKKNLKYKTTDDSKEYQDFNEPHHGLFHHLKKTSPSATVQNENEASLNTLKPIGTEVTNGKPHMHQVEESAGCWGSSSKSKMETNTCPIYYGIKSYVHDFYCPPDKDVLSSGEFVQGDDFRFLADPPGKRSCWERISLWVGVNLMLVGTVGLLVGHLTPTQDAVVSQLQGYTVLDRRAVAYNTRLLLCQLIGLATLLCGTVLVVCSQLIARCRPARGPTYYVVGAALVPQSLVGTPLVAPQNRYVEPPIWGVHQIPLTGSLKSVQPQFLGSQY